MSDQTDRQEEAQTVDLTQEQPDLQTKSEAETRQGNLLAGAELAKAALSDPEAAELLRRQLQSEKDKGVAEATKKATEALNEVERIAKYLDEAGGDVKLAQRNMALDSLIRQSDSPRPSGAEARQEIRQPASDIVNLHQAFSGAGYDVASVPKEDYEYAKSFQGTQTELQEALFNRRMGGTSTKPPANRATALQPGGGHTTPPLSVDEALEQLEDLKAKNPIRSKWSKAIREENAKLLEVIKEATN